MIVLKYIQVEDMHDLRIIFSTATQTPFCRCSTSPPPCETSPFDTARWVDADDAAELDRFVRANQGDLARDREDRPVFLARNSWELSYAQKNYPAVRFNATRERHAA